MSGRNRMDMFEPRVGPQPPRQPQRQQQRSRSRSRPAARPVRDGRHSRLSLARMADNRREEMEAEHGHDRLYPVVANGHRQSRWVQLSITGQWDYYAYGRHWPDKTFEDTRVEMKKIHFSSEREFRREIKYSLASFKAKVEGLDDYYKITWLYEKAEDSLGRDELREQGEDEAHIGIRSAEPIDNRFLRGAELNEMSEADEVRYANCLIKEFICKYQEKIPTLKVDRFGVEKCCDIMGITREELVRDGLRLKKFKKLCEHYSISMLAINHGYRLVVPRLVYPSSKYPCFAFYVYDGHCYPIRDEKVKRHLSACFAEKDEKDTSIINKDESKAEEKEKKAEANRFASSDYKVDVPVTDLDELQDCVVYYNQKGLKEVLVDLLREKNTLFVHTHTRDQISSIKYDNGVYLYANANYKSKMDWTDSMRACEKLGMEFRNQSISLIGWEHMYTYYHPRGTKTKRIDPTKAMRLRIYEEQGHICHWCHEDMAANDYEINHIQAVCDGGPTQRYNLEALHKKCHAEVTAQQAGQRLMNIDNSLSYFNDKTFPIFTRIKNGLCHNFVDVDDLHSAYGEKKLVRGLDLNKCRRNMLRYANQVDWCCFSILDSPQKFDPNVHGEFPRGFYFVVSDNILPLEGNGWYSVPMIEYCLKHKIIQLNQIKFCLLASLKLEPHYFHRWIDKVMSCFPHKKDGDMVKLMVNGVVGMWASRTNKHRHLRFFKVEKAANADVDKRSDPESSFTVLPKWFKLDDESEKPADYYEATWHTESTKLENHMPLFMQCLDLERIEAHRAARRIEKAGGIVCHVNTDSVLGIFKNQKQVDAMWKEASKVEWAPYVPKYKLDQSDEADLLARPEKFQKKEEPNRAVFKLEKHMYRNIRDPGHDDFEKHAKHILDQLKSFMLLGPAGAGKTTMLLALMREMTTRGDKFLVMAPTHQARKLLTVKDTKTAKGWTAKTIHSALSGLKLGTGFLKFSRYKYIIVDEMSMIPEPLWLALCRIRQKCEQKGMSCPMFITSGCMKQLPPVQDRVGGGFNYADCYALHWLVDGTKVHLSENRRGKGDPDAEKLFKMYMKPDTIDLSLFGDKECDRSMCYTNSKRIKVNDHWQQKKAKKAGKWMVLEKPVTGKKQQDLWIHDGMPLVACRTRGQYKICNADRLVVVEWNKKEVTLRHIDENEKEFDEPFVIPAKELSSLVQPGYCLTLHRQQGASINRSYTIYEWSKFDDPMKYVALSRTRALDLINIVHDPTEEIDEPYDYDQDHGVDGEDYEDEEANEHLEQCDEYVAPEPKPLKSVHKRLDEYERADDSSFQVHYPERVL